MSSGAGADLAVSGTAGAVTPGDATYSVDTGNTAACASLAAQIKAATETRGKTVYAFSDEMIASAAEWLVHTEAPDQLGKSDHRNVALVEIRHLYFKMARLDIHKVISAWCDRVIHEYCCTVLR